MNGDADAENGGLPPLTLFSDAALESLFLGFAAYRHVALAVSGGADSTAMMLLVRRWLDLTSRPSQITVLTVDHRLRPESASEAEWVARRAAEFGFAHRTLIWQGEKPGADLQAAARRARYALMTGFCRDHGIGALATAHTSNDQAETLIMRLRRGSGLDGLAGMAPLSERDGIALIRPLLGVTRSRLEAFLRLNGQSWLEDPSNQNQIYERVRIRRALKAAAALGLSMTKATLSAKRLGRARDALEALTSDFIRSHLLVHEAGFGEIAFASFLDAPEEIALRTLARISPAFGGRSAPPRLSKLEAAYAKLRMRPPMLTLGGCQFASRGERLLIVREYGRIRRGELMLLPGQTVVWDRRFKVSLPSTAETPCLLGPLGAAGVQAVKAAGAHFGGMPHLAAIALPSLWDEGGLRFVPFAEFDVPAPPRWLREASAEFSSGAVLFRRARDADAS
jgi:tRNA(Ile)-lysidine synthase